MTRERARERTAELVLMMLVVTAMLVSSTALTSATASGAGERSSPVLRDGTPRQAGLVPAQIHRLPVDLAAYLNPSPTKPLYAGGVVLAGHNGYVVQRAAVGYALRYADADGTELPAHAHAGLPCLAAAVEGLPHP